MIILAIETTGSVGSIAISKDEKIVYHDYLSYKYTQTESILHRIDNILKLIMIKKSELSVITVSIGPGSFTGCRVGLATAKGICEGLQIPLVPLNSLEILAANVYGSDRKILSLIDAKINQAYLAVYDTFLNPEIEPKCVYYEDIKQHLGNNFICVGDYHLISSNSNPAIKKAMMHQNILSASAMLGLLIKKSNNYTYDKDFISSLVPLYLRDIFINKQESLPSD